MEPIGIIPGADQNHKDNAINANFRDISNRLNPIILKDTDGVARYMQGRLPDGTYGERASREGVDVTTADNSGLVYESDFASTTYYDENGVITRKDTGTQTIYYDSNGVPVQLHGRAPDDGRMGLWIVEPGKNVIDELS